MKKHKQIQTLPPAVTELTGYAEIPLELILPNPEQPREEFDPEELAGLAKTIRENGVLQPISVEPDGNGKYYLHAGERRVRAAKMAGLKSIPAIITPALNGNGKEQRLVIALIENIQRANMNPIEEGRGFQALADLGYSNLKISQKMGISLARVSQHRELLKLDEPIQDLISAGRLSKDHRLTKALLDIPDTTARVKIAASIAERGATIKAAVESCKNLVKVMRAEVISDDTPAMYIATKRAGALNRPIWDAFAQVGKVPPWPLVEICARDTCANCGLRDMASEVVCRECPLVEMLRQMIGSTR